MICIDMLLLQSGWTALHIAGRYGYTEVVQHLINNNADISATDNVSDNAVAVFIIRIITQSLIYYYSYEVICNCLLLTCYSMLSYKIIDYMRR